MNLPHADLRVPRSAAPRPWHEGASGRRVASDLRLDPARFGCQRIRRFKDVLRCTALASTLALTLGLGDEAWAFDFLVTNGGDAGANTLRDIVATANGNGVADRIFFAAALANTTITLTTGDIDITEALEIDAQGQKVTISGNMSGRIFAIEGPDPPPVPFVVTLRGLTLKMGATAGDGGAILSEGSGGAVRTIPATLHVEDSTITGNTAEGDGGGIYTEGDLSVRRSTLSGNTAGVDGGAVYFDGDTATIQDSTVSGNTATLGNGGGLYNEGGTMFVFNSTISGNRAPSPAGGQGKGGGLHNTSGGEATVTNSTITGNSARDGGGGVYSDDDMTLRNTIVSGNMAATEPDVYDAGGIGIVGTYNLIGSADGNNFVDGVGGNIVGMLPDLGPLAANGGPTLTHLPNPGSPAIDMGDPAFPLAGAPPAGDPPLLNDQRLAGFPRVVNGRIDIGAVERSTPRLPAVSQWGGAFLALLLQAGLGLRLRSRRKPADG